MENFEKQEGMKFPKPTKQTLIYVGLILGGLLLIWNIYQFGWKKIESHFYQKGFAVGQAEIQAQVVNYFLQNGKVQLTLPVNEQGQFDPNGKQVANIILVPQNQ